MGQILPMKIIECKLTVGRYRRPGKLIIDNGRVFFDFGYWPALNAEIKNMEGRKYHGFDNNNPKKWWSIPLTQRNWFQLKFLMGENPYAKYDLPLIPFTSNRPLFKHQVEFVSHALTRQCCIIAGEMGTGKTLAGIELIEHVLDLTINQFAEDYVWWIGPRSAIEAVKYEFVKWSAKYIPKFMTYERLVRVMTDWQPGRKAPQIVIFDESSKLKTPTAQRSQAGKKLADSVREDWKDQGYVILASGSPAPKSPADWWNQAEIACPGFLVEGDLFKFKNRLGIIQDKENVNGDRFPYLVGWRDNEKKCNTCGLLPEAPEHIDILDSHFHQWTASKNEVSLLYQRLKGLVLVKFKKDCLDLPDKFYKIINLSPAPDILRAAKLITDTAPTAIKALTLLRELSDGFQYVEKATGEQTVCTECSGTGEIPLDDSKIKCPSCNGKKEVPVYARSTAEVPCPKIEQLKLDLEEHEDIGRLVIYAGFTGSIDRIVQTCLAEKWSVLRVDGRGWTLFDLEDRHTDKNLISVFQDRQDEYPRLAFVGHPASAGMGLTLTASPTTIYYSNDFSGEARIQSEDRIHRPGMDLNRGATIKDYIHLPTDLKVLDNLKQKRDLQAMSLGILKDAIDECTKVS